MLISSKLDNFLTRAEIRRLQEIHTLIASPCKQLPTKYSSQIAKLQDVKLVLFDIYGTLLASKAGEVGTAAEANELPRKNFNSALLEFAYNKGSISQNLQRQIRDEHRQIKEANPRIKYAEVDIIRVWHKVLNEISSKAELEKLELGNFKIAELSFEYELLVNSSSLMPGALSCLASLRERGLKLGIVSNAQFYTSIILENLASKSLAELGFEQKYSSWSYKIGVAKPAMAIFDVILPAIHADGIRNSEVLYVGNDMLNDVWGASQFGMKTALFIGDKNSLRLRENHADIKDLKPDIKIKNLAEILDIF